MENKLEIKFKNQKQSFEILEDEIVVDMHTAKHKLKYNIPLDDIKNNWHILEGSLDRVSMGLSASILFNVILMICLLAITQDAPPLAMEIISYLLFLPFIMSGILYAKRHQEKHISSSKLFYFIYTEKNKNEVDRFIDLIFKKQIDFFKRKYYKVDPVLPYQTQYDRYVWLYSNEYITQNDFEDIKEDLDKFFSFNPSI